MTIRRTLRWWFRLLWLGLMGIGVLAASWRPHSWLNYYFRMTALTVLAVSVIGAFVLGFICPRCRGNLLWKSAPILDGRPCVCPKCGISLDDPADSHGNSQ